MTRSLATLAIFGVVACSVTAVAEDDAVGKKLAAAKKTYEADFEKYRMAVGGWFGQREAAARKDGNKKLVDQIRTEREAFEKKGDLPKATPADLKRKATDARKALAAAYKTAVSDYTKARKDTEAAVVEKELAAFLASGPTAARLVSPAGGSPGVVLEGRDGVGEGKHVVLISGDQEYRSEETIPQLAKLLADRHGFRCTVLFTVDKNGFIEPNGPKENGAEVHNIPGLEALKTADLMVVFTRFLNLPDEQMQHIADYVESGKPVVGLRTATHAFNIPGNRKFARYGNGSGVKGWEGGFGRVVLGEKWVAHHGAHGKEGTRGVIAPGQEKNPILRGIKNGDIFGTTDVYTANPPPDSTILVLGQVTEKLQPDSKPVAGKKNEPMMPVAWTRTYKADSGKTGRAFCTTMGASQDFAYEGTRRLIVNGCLWAVGLGDKIPEKTNVDLVGEYHPNPFKSGGHKKGVKPADLFK